MVKLTKKRQLVLNVIKNNKKPVSAEDIYLALKDEDINLSTIYRSLEVFSNSKKILKTIVDNKAYYYLNNLKHSHFLVCEKCGNMIPFDCIVNNVDKSLFKQHNFTVTHHDLTFYGLCSNCNV